MVRLPARSGASGHRHRREVARQRDAHRSLLGRGARWRRAFVPGDHGSTFGGQPLACAAALATLAELESIDAPGLAVRTGSYLAARLEALQGVAAVRGKGLLLASVLDPGLDAAEITAAALRNGLVVNAPVAGVLRLAPPLTVSIAEVDEAMGILGDVLASASKATASAGSGP